MEETLACKLYHPAVNSDWCRNCRLRDDGTICRFLTNKCSNSNLFVIFVESLYILYPTHTRTVTKCDTWQTNTSRQLKLLNQYPPPLPKLQEYNIQKKRSMESQHNLVVAPEKDRQICQLQFGRFCTRIQRILVPEIGCFDVHLRNHVIIILCRNLKK